MVFPLDEQDKADRLLHSLSWTLKQQQVQDPRSELALLVAWAWLSKHDRGGAFPHPQSHEDIGAAYSTLAEHLGVAGQVFVDSRIALECTGRVLRDVRSALAAVEKISGPTLVKALARQLRRLRRYTPRDAAPISDDLAKLLVALGQGADAGVLLAYPAAAWLLPALPQMDKVTLRTSNGDAVSVAMGLIANACVCFPAAPGIPHPEQAGAPVVLAVPPFGKAARRDVEACFGTEADMFRESLVEAEQRLVLAAPGFNVPRKDFRAVFDEALDLQWLDTVIQLPVHATGGWDGPWQVLLFDKTRTLQEPVLFIDAERISTTTEAYGVGTEGLEAKTEILDVWGRREDGKHSKLVAHGEIWARGLDLSPRSYVPGPAARILASMPNTEPLSRLATLVRAQMLSASVGEGEVVLEAAPDDIGDDGILRQPKKSLAVSGRDQIRVDPQRLRPDDILMVIKGGRGSIGRVALVNHACEETWVAGQVFLIIRVHDRAPISPVFLFRYLESEVAQAYVREVSATSSIHLIRANEIKEFPVPVLESDVIEQVQHVHERIVAEYAEIRQHLEKISDLKRDWPVSARALCGKSSDSSWGGA